MYIYIYIHKLAPSTRRVDDIHSKNNNKCYPLVCVCTQDGLLDHPDQQKYGEKYSMSAVK